MPFGVFQQVAGLTGTHGRLPGLTENRSAGVEQIRLVCPRANLVGQSRDSRLFVRGPDASGKSDQVTGVRQEDRVDAGAICLAQAAGPGRVNSGKITCLTYSGDILIINTHRYDSIGSFLASTRLGPVTGRPFFSFRGL